MLRGCQFLTILTSKSCWRAGVVQILATSTSKSAPTPSVFNDFDFQMVLARRRGANFVTSWATNPPHPPVLRTWLFEPAKPQNYDAFTLSTGSFPKRNWVLDRAVPHGHFQSNVYHVFRLNHMISRWYHNIWYIIGVLNIIQLTYLFCLSPCLSGVKYATAPAIASWAVMRRGPKMLISWYLLVPV